MDFLDLGSRRLKDLATVEHVFQVLAQGLAADFPALKTSELHPTNLPAETTSFVGRTAEIRALTELLRQDEVRWVTLTGSAGTGKTRLGLRVASEAVPTYADGVYFIGLDSLGDPAIVLSALASTLGLREEGGETLAGTIADHLANRAMLLVLDNCEHVAAAMPAVVDATRGAPQVKVLATSRARLGVPQEHGFALSPLAVPAADGADDLESLVKCESVALFLRRARVADGAFVLSSGNAPAVAEICRKVDGLPLAIELIAARVRLFPPETLVARLTDYSDLLSEQSRGTSRHETLRAALDWSYDLLGELDREVFRSLSVFLGGFTVASAGAVVPDGTIAGISSLVDKSLLRQIDRGTHEPAFTMLESVRAYGLDHLEKESSLLARLASHAGYFLNLALEGREGLEGPQGKMWLDRLQADLDNLRAALGHFVGVGNGQSALRLAAAVAPFWERRGGLTEGREWLRRALAISGPDDRYRALALDWAGRLARLQGDNEVAGQCGREALRVFVALGDRRAQVQALNNLASAAYNLSHYAEAADQFARSLDLSRDIADRRGIARALGNLGAVRFEMGHYADARSLFEESLEANREFGDDSVIALWLNNLGMVAHAQGDTEAARAFYSESLAMRRELGDLTGVVYCLHSLAALAWTGSEFDRSGRLQEEALTLAREIGDQHMAALCLAGLAWAIRRRGDVRSALAFSREGLIIRRDLGDEVGMADALEGMAVIVSAGGKWTDAARLLGAAATAREKWQRPLTPTESANLDREVRHALGGNEPDGWDETISEGRKLPLDAAVEFGLRASNPKRVAPDAKSGS